MCIRDSYVICSTVKSNVLYESVLDRERDWIFEDVSKCFEALALVESDCEAQADQYRKDLEYQIAYRTFRTGEPVSAYQENLLEMHGWRYRSAVRPRSVLLMDDCSHSLLFSKSQKNPLTNLVLRSRHVGDGCGLSIAMIAQTYTSGIPRALRQNLTHMAVFYTASDREVKSMYEELGGLVSFDRFKELFVAYTLSKHSYLWCDLIERQLRDSF